MLCAGLASKRAFGMLKEWRSGQTYAPEATIDMAMTCKLPGQCDGMAGNCGSQQAATAVMAGREGGDEGLSRG